jgi:hypothetical protein
MIQATQRCVLAALNPDGEASSVQGALLYLDAGAAEAVATTVGLPLLLGKRCAGGSCSEPR